MAKWKAPRATTVERNSITPDAGELIYDEDENAFYYGDGVTAGGIKFDSSPAGQSDTGWASYVDTTYTSGSPLTVSAGVVTKLPNNAGTIVDSQKPSDITAFYDSTTQKILGRNGDGLGISLFFFAVPSAANQSIDMYIDITGGTGTPASLAKLYRQTFPFPKGAGTARGILFDVTSAYTLNTWDTNGGDVYVESASDFDVYGMIFNFVRTHKAT